MKTNNRLIISLFLVLLVFGVNVAKGQIQNRIIRPENAQMNGVEIDRVKALSGRVPYFGEFEIHLIPNYMAYPFRLTRKN